MKNSVKFLTLSAMFTAIGILLPFLTGQIPQIGNMLLPMHIPVLLCGMICGWQYGAVVGLILPLLRSLIFSMPPLYPTAISMAFELLTYGIVSGLVFTLIKKKSLVTIYASLVIAMLSGRVIWGIAQMILLGMSDKAFTWKLFVAGAFTNAVPGIVLQLVLIPAVMVALNKAGFIKIRKASENNG